MKRLLLLLPLFFSTTLFANSETLELPNSTEVAADSEPIYIPGDDDVVSRDPYNDGCRINVGFLGHRRFESNRHARNFCDSFHNFFNVRNRCFVIHNNFANWDYSYFFTGKGNDWKSARRNVHQQYIDHVFGRRFDRYRFGSHRSYPFTCGD